MKLEYCYLCGEPTGKAGRADDSLYCDSCEEGPFCDECYDAHKEPCMTASYCEAKVEVAQLQTQLERLDSWAGLMELLDRRWPEETFQTLPDDPQRDAGARIVSLLRRVDGLQAELAAARDALALFKRDGENCYCDRYYDPSCGHQERCVAAAAVAAAENQSREDGKEET